MIFISLLFQHPAQEVRTAPPLLEGLLTDALAGDMIRLNCRGQESKSQGKGSRGSETHEDVAKTTTINKSIL